MIVLQKGFVNRNGKEFKNITNFEKTKETLKNILNKFGVKFNDSTKAQIRPLIKIFVPFFLTLFYGKAKITE